MCSYIIELEDYPGYFVSEDGKVYSEKSGKMKIKKQSIRNTGYYFVSLQKNGHQYTVNIHRLLAETFIANPKKLPQIDHINRNKLDNRLENLRWVSPQDNNRNHGLLKINKYGHTGIRFRKEKNAWCSRWNIGVGKNKSKHFSVKQYGFDEAKQMAIDYREKMVRELYNRP